MLEFLMGFMLGRHSAPSPQPGYMKIETRVPLALPEPERPVTPKSKQKSLPTEPPKTRLGMEFYILNKYMMGNNDLGRMPERTCTCCKIDFTYHEGDDIQYCHLCRLTISSKEANPIYE